MECPFELPVKISPKIGMFCVLRSREGGHLAELLYRKDADYIVQAINCHEKLMEACDSAYSFMISVTNLDNNENLKWQEEVTEELKQALKQAEKP